MVDKLNLISMTKSLCLGRYENAKKIDWLEKSFKKPEQFWKLLLSTREYSSPKVLKSHYLDGYNFYHDIIVFNEDNPKPAYIWYDNKKGWQNISYYDLGVYASRKASMWLKKGVKPGQKMCILANFEVEFIISLIACLKIGLIYSVLPPIGSQFVIDRINNLNPDFINTDEIYISLLNQWRKKVIDDKGYEDLKFDFYKSSTYLSGSVISNCFNVAKDDPSIPTQLTADACYLFPMRDGLIALGLQSGQAYAAFGFHFLETQPALLFNAFLNGATYVHADMDDIQKNPELVIKHPLQAVGVCNRLRDILIENPQEAKESWNFWFKNPNEPFDYNTWKMFVTTLELDNIYIGNMKINAAHGGCMLFSNRRKGEPHNYVLPSAGVPWGFGDMITGKMESLIENYGIFAIDFFSSEDEDKTPTSYVLSKINAELMFLGSLISGKRGRTYPLSEVLRSVLNVSRCIFISAVKLNTFNGYSDPPIALIAFYKPSENFEESIVRKEILRKIENKMGKEFFPTRILFFPLCPRKDSEGNFDHKRAREEYTTGALFIKSKEEIYQTLSSIRFEINGY